MNEQFKKELLLLLKIVLKNWKEAYRFMKPKFFMTLKYIRMTEEEKLRVSKQDKDDVIVFSYLVFIILLFMVSPVIIIKVVL